MLVSILIIILNIIGIVKYIIVIKIIIVHEVVVIFINIKLSMQQKFVEK